MEFAVYTISIKGLFSKRYEIYRDDELVYWVQKPSFFAFRELDFIDRSGNKVLQVYRHTTFFSYKFTFSKDGNPIATFEKDSFESFYKSTSINGYHTLQGDFFGSEYTVFNEEKEIAKISRKRFASHKKYGVAIIKGNDELYILAMVIAISVIKKNRRKKA